MKVLECLRIPVHIMALKHPKGQEIKGLDKVKKVDFDYRNHFLTWISFWVKASDTKTRVAKSASQIVFRGLNIKAIKSSEVTASGLRLASNILSRKPLWKVSARLINSFSMAQKISLFLNSTGFVIRVDTLIELEIPENKKRN